MKKLMIAAAAAALVSGAWAVAGDYAYDFKASLKTTSARQQKLTTTYTIKLGQNTNGDYWYTAGAIDDFTNAYPGAVTFDKNGVGKLNLNKLTGTAEEKEDAKLTLAQDLYDYGVACIGKEYVGGNGVPEYYRNKETWCATFTAKVTDSDCYRVAGSVTLKGLYFLEDCCGETFYNSYETGPGLLGNIDVRMLFRFGSIANAKATKVEFLGTVNEFKTYAIDKELEDVAWALAGQGTWATLTDSEKQKAPGVKSISGNIVGVWGGPQCEICCGADRDAIVWSCDPEDDENNDDGNDIIDVGTAAFGTFSLTFNSKYSDFGY